MAQDPKYRRTDNRPLSDAERTLLKWLIEHGSPDAHEFTPQIEQLRVVGHCGCGCPTIDFAVEGANEPTTGASQILADFTGETPENVTVGVLVHAREGKLSELEIYSVAGDIGTFSLPVISTLR